MRKKENICFLESFKVWFFVKCSFLCYYEFWGPNGDGPQATVGPRTTCWPCLLWIQLCRRFPFFGFFLCLRLRRLHFSRIATHRSSGGTAVLGSFSVWMKTSRNDLYEDKVLLERRRSNVETPATTMQLF